MLCHFYLFFKLFLVVLTAKCQLWHMGSWGMDRVSWFILREHELACFLYLCQHPLSHFTKLLDRDLFIGLYHRYYIFVTPSSFWKPLIRMDAALALCVLLLCSYLWI